MEHHPRGHAEAFRAEQTEPTGAAAQREQGAERAPTVLQSIHRVKAASDVADRRRL